jgi:two-component system, LuxR family, response regulator FixJ
MGRPLSNIRIASKLIATGAKAHVVDDDDAAREALAFLLSTANVPVQTYPSARAFLAVAAEARGVVVTDISMPAMDGIELVRRLQTLGITLPVIVMTGHGDIPLAVEAMKAGAMDFIEKPYNNEAMLAAVAAGLARRSESEARDEGRAEMLGRYERLSARERQVLGGLIAGCPNKVIARDLEISPRTVEIYRANVMTKMRSGSLSELVRMALTLGLA